MLFGEDQLVFRLTLDCETPVGRVELCLLAPQTRQYYTNTNADTNAAATATATAAATATTTTTTTTTTTYNDCQVRV